MLAYRFAIDLANLAVLVVFPGLLSVPSQRGPWSLEVSLDLSLQSTDHCYQFLSPSILFFFFLIFVLDGSFVFLLVFFSRVGPMLLCCLRAIHRSSHLTGIDLQVFPIDDASLSKCSSLYFHCSSQQNEYVHTASSISSSSLCDASFLLLALDDGVSQKIGKCSFK